MTANEILAIVADAIEIPIEQKTLELHLRLATISAHSLASFSRDRQAMELELETPARTFSCSIENNFPGFRAMRKVVSSEGITIPPVTITTALLKTNGLESGYSIVGDTLTIKLPRSAANFSLIYLVHPVMEPLEHYNSWIAAQYPAVLINDMVRKIASTKGLVDLRNTYERFYLESVRTLISDQGSYEHG